MYIYITNVYNFEHPENHENLKNPENPKNLKNPENPENHENPENPENPENLKILDKKITHTHIRSSEFFVKNQIGHDRANHGTYGPRKLRTKKLQA